MTDPAGRNEPGSPDARAPLPAHRQPSENAPSGGAQYSDRVYRSVSGVVSGVLLLAIAAWLVGDAVLYGGGRAPWIALAVLFLAVPVIVAYTIRPVVYADDSRVLVRNPLRTIVAPWGAVQGLRAGYSVELLAGGKTYQVWAVPVSLRQRQKAGRAAGRAATGDLYVGRGGAGRAGAGRTTTAGRPAVAGLPDPTRAWSDQVVDTLREIAERNADNPDAAGEVSTAWCWWIIAPTVVGLATLLVLLGTG